MAARRVASRGVDAGSPQSTGSPRPERRGARHRLNPAESRLTVSGCLISFPVGFRAAIEVFKQGSTDHRVWEMVREAIRRENERRARQRRSAPPPTDKEAGEDSEKEKEQVQRSEHASI